MSGKMLGRFILPFAALLAAVPGYAAPSVTISPAGSGSFVVRGTGFNHAATVDLQISYDSAALSNPRVAGGALAANGFTAANATAPGSLSLSVVANGPMTGSGPLASITFDRIGGATGGITTVTGRIIGVDGNIVPVVIFGEAAAQQTGDSTTGITGSGKGTSSLSGANDQQGGVTSGSGSSAGPAVVGGSVTLPGDPFRNVEEAREQPAQVEEQELAAGGRREDVAEARQTARGEESKAAPAERPEPEIHSASGEGSAVPVLVTPLENFRTFTGEATPHSLLALLKSAAPMDLVQEPAVAIADGKATVKVKVKVPGEKAPNFALNAARTVSVALVEGGYQLEIQPVNGALQASIMVVTGSSLTEMPLTVAPPADVDLDRSGKVTEGDFALFLTDRGKPAPSRFDLNGDGRHDYMDDYIFTANYFAAIAKQEKEGPGKQDRATKRPMVADAALAAGGAARK
ncbi:hypothetical protein LPW11_20380 [Geomonas sp. RF6]|uniref:hypothetical protein n=1 Tax=Geomonas sp. RF6 TaxID=2897342 RepID=UPI001E438391|nr:hypothetical protein [Geomonas sp. RF6]UFS70218.1 hypothetical protein LPW11_20380 [Geomonas sp. RF6]